MMIQLRGIQFALSSLQDRNPVSVRRPGVGTYEHGRWIAQEQKELKIRASIQTAGDKDLQDVDEGRRVNGGIKVYTKTLLQTASVDGKQQPDIIDWHGESYLVEKVFDWNEAGGYYKALATRMGQ